MQGGSRDLGRVSSKPQGPRPGKGALAEAAPEGATCVRATSFPVGLWLCFEMCLEREKTWYGHREGEMQVKLLHSEPYSMRTLGGTE